VIEFLFYATSIECLIEMKLKYYPGRKNPL